MVEEGAGGHEGRRARGCQGAVLWVRELTVVLEVRRVRGMVERERGKRLMLALA